MANETFKEILGMVVAACNKYLFVDRDLQKKELECATQIYIAQMKEGATDGK